MQIFRLYRNVSKVFSISSSGERTPIAGTPPPMEILFRSSLPWKPKVREEDIEAFLQHERYSSGVLLVIRHGPMVAMACKFVAVNFDAWWGSGSSWRLWNGVQEMLPLLSLVDALIDEIFLNLSYGQAWLVVQCNMELFRYFLKLPQIGYYRTSTKYKNSTTVDNLVINRWKFGCGIWRFHHQI